MVQFWKVSSSFGAILGRRVATGEEIRSPSLTTAVYKFSVSSRYRIRC